MSIEVSLPVVDSGGEGNMHEKLARFVFSVRQSRIDDLAILVRTLLSSSSDERRCCCEV